MVFNIQDLCDRTRRNELRRRLHACIIGTAESMGLTAHQDLLQTSAERKSAKALQERAAQQRARLFKELDITLSVLGIPENTELSNALSAALHDFAFNDDGSDAGCLTSSRGAEPAQALPKASAAAAVERLTLGRIDDSAVAQPAPQAPSSSRRAPPRTRSFRSLVASARADEAHEQAYQQHVACSLQSQLSNASAASSSAAVAMEAPSEQDMERLFADRQNWHEALTHVLEGGVVEEDVDTAVQQAAFKAEGVQAQLQALQRRLPDSWQVCEQQVVLLEAAARKAREATRHLRAHVELLEASGRVAVLATVLKDTTQDLVAVCVVLVEAAEALLGRDAPLAGGEEEVAAAFAVLRRMVGMLRDVAHRCRVNTRQFPEHAQLCRDSEAQADALAQRLCSSCVSAAKRLQETVLVPASVSGRTSPEVLVAKAKLLALMWRLCGDLIGKTATAMMMPCEWAMPQQQPGVPSRLCTGPTARRLVRRTYKHRAGCPGCCCRCCTGRGRCTSTCRRRWLLGPEIRMLAFPTFLS